MFAKSGFKTGLVVLLLTSFLMVGLLSCSNAVATDEKPVETASFSDSRASLANPKSGVMLQGFNWESASRSNSSTHGKWYSTMQGKASEIKNTFEYVWFPPPSLSASTEGYLPTQLNNFNSAYGTEAELKKVISL